MSSARRLAALVLAAALVMGCGRERGERRTTTTAVTASQSHLERGDAAATESATGRQQRAPTAVEGDRTIAVVDPKHPQRIIAAAANSGGLVETLDGGGSWRPANAPSAGYVGAPVRWLQIVQHAAEGLSLLVQCEASAAGGPSLHRVALSRLRDGPARALALRGRVAALATDPHTGRRGRVAALILEAEAGAADSGSVAYSDDAGDSWRRFHPGGRIHFAPGLAFGSDGHLWMVSLASITAADASRLGAERLREAALAMRAERTVAKLKASSVPLLDQPAIFAINTQRGVVTERLPLPIPATRIAVHPDLKGTAWLAGKQGLLRLHAGKLQSVTMRREGDSAIALPLSPVGISVDRRSEDRSERVFVSLAASAADERATWQGQRVNGRWRFERVGEGVGAWSRRGRLK